MPLLSLKCPQGHVWDSLSTIGHEWNCPTCGEKGENVTLFQSPNIRSSNDGDEEQAFNALPATERQMILQNRRALEKDSQSILEGTRRIVMGKRFRNIERPICPKELRKYT